MWAAAIGPIIQLILWILGFAMERARLTLQQKESFYNFVKEMSHLGWTPIRLKQSAEKQLEMIKALKAQQKLILQEALA